MMAVLVNPDQTCGVKGRSGSLNLLLIRDIISWVEERDLPLCILSLDQEKAFDRVNHEFLFLSVRENECWGKVYFMGKGPI